MSWIRRILGARPEPEDPETHAASVKARYADGLLASADVVSVGIGRDEHHVPVIVVGVARISAQSAVLPSTLEGVPVVVQQMGTPSTQA